MSEFTSYKLHGSCTRKVLFEKYFSIQQKLEWVIKNEQLAKKRKDEKAREGWAVIKSYYMNHTEKFERMVNKMRNELNLK